VAWAGCLIGAGDPGAFISNGVEESLEHWLRRISGISAVGGESDTSGDVLDRVEVLDRALIGKHPEFQASVAPTEVGERY